MIRFTQFCPAAEYVWLGFWTELEALSPKFHCQEVGLPVEVSMNCTACLIAGEEGL
jgi:hypothetical protein